MLIEPRVEGRIRLRDGRRIGFAEYGDPAGRPILWFHGMPGGRRQIPPAARSFAVERGIRLVGLERPGIGDSTAHLHQSLLGSTSDVEQVADELGIGRFGLVGLSGGGPYVLACAYQMPGRVVAGAVLGGVAPTCGDEAAEGGAIALGVPLASMLEAASLPIGSLLWGVVRLLDPLGSQVFDAFIRLMPEGDQQVFQRPEIKAMFIDDLSRASRRQLLAPIYDAVQFTRPWGFSLREIRVPIRFWHGDADNLVPLGHARHMARLVPNSELRVRKGEGHIGNLAAAEEILGVMLSLWPPETHAARRRGRRGRPKPQLAG